MRSLKVGNKDEPITEFVPGRLYSKIGCKDTLYLCAYVQAGTLKDSDPVLVSLSTPRVVVCGWAEEDYNLFKEEARNFEVTY